MSGSADQGHRHKGLESLLLQFRHVVEARVVERVLADERRLATFEHPPREALSPRQADPAGEIRVRLRRGIEIETVTVGGEEVDEAGMDGACIREQAHDRRQHLLEIERGRHRRDDLGEESLLAPLHVVRPGYVTNRTRGGVKYLHLDAERRAKREQAGPRSRAGLAPSRPRPERHPRACLRSSCRRPPCRSGRGRKG